MAVFESQASLLRPIFRPAEPVEGFYRVPPDTVRRTRHHTLLGHDLIICDELGFAAEMVLVRVRQRKHLPRPAVQ